METMVYTVDDIRKLLGVSRSAAYDYVKKVEKEKQPFRVIRVGTTYRIPKESFNSWLTGC